MYVEHTDNNEPVRCSTVELNDPNVVELSKLNPLFINCDVTNNENLFTVNVYGEDRGGERGEDKEKDLVEDGDNGDAGDDGNVIDVRDEDRTDGKDWNDDGADSDFSIGDDEYNGDDIPNLDANDDKMFDENVQDLCGYVNVKAIYESNVAIRDFDEDLYSPYESNKDHARLPIYRKDYEIDDPFGIGLVYDDTK